MKPRQSGFRHLIDSTHYSLKGLRAAFRNETAFRQEVGICVILLPLAWWIGSSPVEWLLLVGSCALVLMVELLNSAVENVVDRIGPEHHELSGRAKDIGSAAVMISLIMAGLTWVLLAWQKFFG
ncbi:MULTISPECIES: diacylglycerol kinase [Chromohalobacter]|jgi:diacylglycerol kinase (ATP)|uniref:Diacylglycerol kinase n=1 Tax=Chromohalobacter israelensis (strain ATCC BAA-138 / DSM 3043 / CIP 106854 / NCIMB 13768 / 1H11) TaxID=290398 RepID=Q1QTD4_CHRI1|nr:MULTISPECIES: diacylglycerol kinase [Chromohalobacter]ABE60274.1 diacylglycerol kinase [Chromohalobacter salexigens DSM 3043]MDF9434756.1 diacylglycerol kinase [Chromohalobacter israelensis]MDO0946136.1 diacylglycerol kinase [Chromohalobacter salexigens]NQY45239.1 diacylglycerol kinase [Chromohalobacter sp.]NWO56461.1 diacylglycerol kinase [Chromohalobacter salexigens]